MYKSEYNQAQNPLDLSPAETREALARENSNAAIVVVDDEASVSGGCAGASSSVSSSSTETKIS